MVRLVAFAREVGLVKAVLGLDPECAGMVGPGFVSIWLCFADSHWWVIVGIGISEKGVSPIALAEWERVPKHYGAELLDWN
jgi:hypothetical protein